MPPRRAPASGNQEENSVNHQGNNQGNGPPPPPPSDAATRALEGMARLFEQQLQQQQLQQQQLQLQLQQLQQQQVHFRYLNMGDADRVRCTTYLLRDDASLWWEGVEHGVNLATITWPQFKDIFYEKYFTADARGRLKREFMSLRQGDLSVADYVKKFDRGCHFVPLIARDPAEKLRHFMDGLRPTLRNNVMMMNPVDYAAATAYAFRSEQSLREIDFEIQRKRQQHNNNSQPNKRQNSGPSRPQGPQKPQGQNRNRGQQRPQNQGAPPPAERPLCKECNRPHAGKCEWGSYKCFYCKESGHKAIDCPKKKAPTTGRVYVMNAEEAEEEADTTLITDALSRKAAVITQLSLQRPLQSEIQQFELTVYARGEAPNLATLSVQSTLRDRIRESQSNDEQLQKWRARDEAKGRNLYSVVDGLVRYRDRLWVPSDNSLRELIMKEAHDSPYSIHPGTTNMFKDLQLLYWWPGMKRDILRFVSECLTWIRDSRPLSGKVYMQRWGPSYYSVQRSTLKPMERQA
ncbi:uncharacterized protein [Primulina eburnea]|uniref:uncharacterized protein n=1 Tax=Primulina eburnea TaxID=1245227 RepID=UPI003C6C7E78